VSGCPHPTEALSIPRFQHGAIPQGIDRRHECSVAEVSIADSSESLSIAYLDLSGQLKAQSTQAIASVGGERVAL
jgi:hypothetical protein